MVNAALDAYGAVRVTGFDDLIETAGLLGTHGPAVSPAIGIISTSGGAGWSRPRPPSGRASRCRRSVEDARARLLAAAPDFAAVANPADMSGMFVEDPEIFRGSLAAFLEEPSIEAVVLVLMVHPPELSNELARRSIEAAAARPALVVLWTAGAMSDRRARCCARPGSGDRGRGSVHDGLAARARAGGRAARRCRGRGGPPALAAARAAGRPSSMRRWSCSRRPVW